MDDDDAKDEWVDDDVMFDAMFDAKNLDLSAIDKPLMSSEDVEETMFWKCI